LGGAKKQKEEGSATIGKNGGYKIQKKGEGHGGRRVIARALSDGKKYAQKQKSGTPFLQ